MPGNTKKKRGEIIVKGDTVKESNDEIGFLAEATLTHSFKGFCCGNNNPYLLIYRSRGENGSAEEFIRVDQTANQPDTLNPNFTRQKLLLRLELLCNSDKDLKLKFEVRNYNDNKFHDIYGSAFATVN